MSSAWFLKGIRLRVLPKDQYVYQITLKVYVTTKLILGTFLVVNFFHFTVIEATGLLGTLRFKSCFVPLTLIYASSLTAYIYRKLPADSMALFIHFKLNL